MITYLKDEMLDDLLEGKRVVVDFYADWCMPCNMLGEMIESVVNDNKDINVVKINVDEHPEIAGSYGVMSIPYLVLFDDKKIIKKQIGLMEEDEFLEWLK